MGDAPFSDTLALIQAKRRNLTENAEFKRIAGFKQYETYARGFVHPKRILAFTEDKYEESDEILDGLGLDGITSVTAHLGFEGWNQRQTFVFKTTGPRKGLVALLSAKSSIQLEELPALPPDAVSVSARAIDPRSIFVAAAKVIEMTLFFLDEEPSDFTDSLEEFVNSIDLKLRADLLSSLESKVVISTTPSEGPFLLGTAVLIRVKDAKKLRKTLAAIEQGFAEASTESPMNIKRRRYRGCELYMLGVADTLELPILPTCAIHDGWFVVGFFPQVVQGFINRSSGKYATWKPSPLLAQQMRAAADPDDSEHPTGSSRIFTFSQTNSRFWVKLLLSLAPTFTVGIASELGASDPFDLSFLPTAQVVCEALLPAEVSISVDDGHSIRIEKTSSLPPPFNLSATHLFLAYSLMVSEF